MKSLQQSLALGMTMPVYIFCGNDAYLMEQALHQLSEVVNPGGNPWNQEIMRGDEHEILDVIDAVQSAGFFTDKKLVIVRDAVWLRPRRKKAADHAENEPDGGDKKQLEQLIQYVRDPNPATVLVMTVDGNVNRASRLVKAVASSGRIVEFRAPKGAEREQWLANYLRAAGKTVEPGLCAYLSLMCGDGVAALKSEADKLILYCANQTLIRQEDAEAVVSRSSLAGVFELTDLVVAKKAAAAVDVLRRLLIQGEAPQALVGMLSHQYRTTIAAKDMLQRGFRSPEIASKLGINPYFAKKCVALSRTLDYRQLMRILDILLLADLDGKNGKGDAAQLLELAILKICAL